MASLAAFVGALNGLTACSRTGGDEGAKTYQIPWPVASGEYRLQDVKIESFEHPETLQGPYARILVDPFVANGQLDSSPAVGRFIRSGDVAVPADYVTLLSTTVYAHSERLYDIDVQMGVAGGIRWPLNIGVQANVADQSRPNSYVLNNALYDGGLDALLIVPYTDRGIPIAMNAGILAHEHFHRIFQSLVLERIRNLPTQGPQGSGITSLRDRHCNWMTAETPFVDPRLLLRPKYYANLSEIVVPHSVYNDFVLRGMNEGLADFWGWVYTGDVNFIGHSLTMADAHARRLDGEVKKLDTAATLKERLKNSQSPDGLVSEGDRIGIAYTVGTDYARFMRALALKISGGQEADLKSRLIVAQALVKTLPQIGEMAAQKFTTDDIAPESLLKPLLLNLPMVTAEACALVDTFANADAKAIKPAQCLEAGGQK